MAVVTYKEDKEVIVKDITNNTKTVFKKDGTLYKRNGQACSMFEIPNRVYDLLN